MTQKPTLSVDALHAFYGRSHVLQGVDLRVRSGEIVGLLGRNGSGRSTVLKAIMGLADARGSVAWAGTGLLGRPPFEIARAGVGYVPETRDVFTRLSVRQNLQLGLRRGALRPGDRLEAMYTMFPALAERRDTPAGVLSGGEQQMLALARTLMGEPGLLLVDEPTEGLAPQVVETVARALVALRRSGVAVLLAEQKLAIVLEIADRCCVMGHGRVVFDGPPAALRSAGSIRSEWLEL